MNWSPFLVLHLVSPLCREEDCLSPGPFAHYRSLSLPTLFSLCGTFSLLVFFRLVLSTFGGSQTSYSQDSFTRLKISEDPKNFCLCGLYIYIYIFFFSLINLFIYFWLRWVFVAANGLSLVAASGGYSSLWYAGFSLRWLLLLRSLGSKHEGFSSCGTRAQ